jgi:hypothetical protein
MQRSTTCESEEQPIVLESGGTQREWAGSCAQVAGQLASPGPVSSYARARRARTRDRARRALSQALVAGRSVDRPAAAQHPGIESQGSRRTEHRTHGFRTDRCRHAGIISKLSQADMTSTCFARSYTHAAHLV